METRTSAKKKSSRKKLSKNNLSRFEILIGGKIEEVSDKLISLNGNTDSDSESRRRKYLTDLRHLKLAQEAVKEKTFGYCEECEERIPDKRLEICFPILCKTCLDDVEKRSKRR
jgi:RNA polymerase-binding transcription factor DksA